VIAPCSGGSRNPLDGDATRTICVLLVSDRPQITSEYAARYLRYTPWTDRRRRYIKPGDAGSFSAEELAVRSGLASIGPSDESGLTEAFSFGHNPHGQNGVTASLALYVRRFYQRLGLGFIHEIRVSEHAAARLEDGQYQLFWNADEHHQTTTSNEMDLLLTHFAEKREALLPTWPAWGEDRSFLLDGYKFEYGGLNAPYNQKDSGKEPTEVLHPLFVRRDLGATLRIGHVTDPHVDIRHDVYERNLSQDGPATRGVDDVRNMSYVSKNGLRRSIKFHNWNQSFLEVYNAARPKSDVILLTGDLINYGRGHIGAAHPLGRDDRYFADRNWFLFYYLLARRAQTGESYDTPVFTILGNHDWRLNPYPPFAPSSPGPDEFIHNHEAFTPEEQAHILRIAHGSGHELSYMYTMTLHRNSSWLDKLAFALSNPGKIWAGLIGRLSFPESPVYTTEESVAWYLMLINPFLDYQFALPSGHQFLMLDFAENEELPRVDMIRGRSVANASGQRAGNCLTSLQEWHVDQFTKPRSGTAKSIGMHVPPVGPRPNWHLHDLLAGRKLAVLPDGAPSESTAADYGSFVNKDTRRWFIRKIAAPDAGVCAVLSGHIHRPGFLLVGPEPPSSDPQALVVRGLPASFQGVPSSARIGPLYVNTTSAGPRGKQYVGGEQYRQEHPGFSVVHLSTDGTIGALKVSLPQHTVAPSL
jgi:hypothetical protein